MLDPQMRRGLLETCVLAAMCRGESYGYRIIKDLEPFVPVSESTLYPILRRLESSGCLAERSVAHNGRLRKMYSITENGQRRIDEFLEEWDALEKMYEFVRESRENDQK